MFALCVHYYLNTACEISGSWSVIFWFILFFLSASPQNDKLPESTEHNRVLPSVPAVLFGTW